MKSNSSLLKIITDIVPLAILFLTYIYHAEISNLLIEKFDWKLFILPGEKMLFALVIFLPFYLISFFINFLAFKKIDKFQLTSFIIVVLTVSLSVSFKNSIFFYIKPTIFYCMMALYLIIERYTKVNPLSNFLLKEYEVPPKVLYGIMIQSSIFFFCLALLNEFAWRFLTSECDLADKLKPCEGEDIWIKIKIFGFTILTFVYFFIQTIKIMKYNPEFKEKK